TLLRVLQARNILDLHHSAGSPAVEGLSALLTMAQRGAGQSRGVGKGQHPPREARDSARDQREPRGHARDQGGRDQGGHRDQGRRRADDAVPDFRAEPCSLPRGRGLQDEGACGVHRPSTTFPARRFPPGEGVGRSQVHGLDGEAAVGPREGSPRRDQQGQREVGGSTTSAAGPGDRDPVAGGEREVLDGPAHGGAQPAARVAQLRRVRARSKEGPVDLH
ncbi:unnamed protein product, partial [Prorocentrum cordatum]